MGFREGFLEAVPSILNLSGNQARVEKEFQAEETEGLEAGKRIRSQNCEEEMPGAWLSLYSPP